MTKARTLVDEPSLIRHEDTQFGLQKLGLPMITLVAEHCGSSCGQIVLDDDDVEIIETQAQIETDSQTQQGSGVEDLDLFPICDGRVGSMLKQPSLDSQGWDWGEQETQQQEPSEATSSQGLLLEGARESQLQLVSASGPESRIVPVDPKQTNRWNAVQLGQLTQVDFQLMHPQKSVSVAAKACRTLATQTDKYKNALNQLKVLKRKVIRQEKALKKKQKQLDEARAKTCLDIVSVGKTGKRMSTSSAFAIGFRRNLSNISAADFGSTVMMDISHQRVCRSEVKTAAAVLSRMKAFCAAFMDALYCNNHPDHPSPALPPVVGELAGELGEGVPLLSDLSENFSLMTVAFRCDATNSSIWKREKLHVLDVDVAMVTNFDSLRKYDANNAITFRRCLLLSPVSAV